MWLPSHRKLPAAQRNLVTDAQDASQTPRPAEVLPCVYELLPPWLAAGLRASAPVSAFAVSCLD